MNATKTEASADNTEARPIKDIQVCDAHGKPTTIEPGKLVFVNPNDLTIHPVLARFPRLGDSDKSILRNDIKEKGYIIHPVLADLGLRVYDGFHRTEIAKELKLDSVPVFINDKADPQEAAMASCLARRNLDKGGIAFVLFEAYPEIVKERENRKQFNLLNGKETEGIAKPLAQKIEIPSFKALSEKYAVPREYFSYLAEMGDASNDDDWKEIRKAILKGIPLTSVYRGFKGRIATKDKLRDPVDHLKCLSTALIGKLETAFTHWSHIKPSERDKLIDDFVGSLDKWPQDDGLRIANRMVEFFQAPKSATTEDKGKSK